MKHKKNRKTRLYFALGMIILLSAYLVVKPQKVNPENWKEYNNAGDEIVVIFDKEVEEEYLHSLIASFDISIEVLRHIGDYALLLVKDSDGYQYVLENLQKNPQVKAAQENYSIATMGVSNDPYSDTQWAIENPGHFIYLSNSGREIKTSIENVDMDVLEAWKQFAPGEKREVVVAVIDTGIDYAHPDLAAHMWINKGEIPGDGIDNDGNGYIDDIYGWDYYNDDATVCHYKYYPAYGMDLSMPEDNDDHGTHVAGIIGAVANNNIGIAGIASNIDIKIMSLKINGGPNGTGNLSSAIEAIKYATMMGANICNLSWGTSQYTPALKQIMMEADMLFVAAAGNSGTNNNSKPIYPASLKLDNLISVTFIDSAGKLTKLSNYGTSSIDLAAPGEDIFSTIVGSYSYMSGSSMAAPHVTAVAAIMYAYADNLYPSNVKEVILNSIKPLSNLEGLLKNPGIPSAYLAVMANDSLIKDINPPEMTFETIYNKDEMLIPVNVLDQGGSGIRALKWIYGNRTKEEFRRGMAGTLVENYQLNVAKAGAYTFYASDYSGNETIEIYEVKEDVKPPKVTSSFTVADSYKTRTINVKVSDAQSGIKRAKYMKGVKKASDFLPAGAGTEIELKNGKGTFSVKKDGTYSIYATDYRGNNTVKQIVVKTVKATNIKFIKSKMTMQIGEQHDYRALVKPVNTTDKITYTSSNKKIATISSTGKIKAIKAGKVTISAKSSSGITANCEITINKIK